jgi:hypothetical protein
MGPLVVHPYRASATPWRNVERAPLRWLPIETTLLNDLPLRLNRPERGPHELVKAPTVFLYYMDGNTYLLERDGVWIAGAATAETIVRTEKPILYARFTFSTPIDNDVRGHFNGRPMDAALKAGDRVIIQVAPGDGRRYHDSYAYVLRLTTARGFIPSETEPGSADRRNLGVFVRIEVLYATP